MALTSQKSVAAAAVFVNDSVRKRCVSFCLNMFDDRVLLSRLDGIVGSGADPD